MEAKVDGAQSACRRCEVIPTLDAEASYLYLNAPEAATYADLTTIAKEQGLTAEGGVSRPMRIELPADKRTAFAESCRKRLNHIQLHDTRALLSSKTEGWTMEEILDSRPLIEYVAVLQHDFLLNVLRNNRLTSVFHPIVHTNDPGNIYAYECLLRAIDDDGSIAPPSRIFAIARDAQLLFQLDRAARLCALEGAAQHGIKQNIFINFVPTTIYKSEFCLRTTFAAVKEFGLDASKIIFEVVESESVTDISHLRTILNEYRAQGFRVALDDLGAGYSSLNMLHELRPDVVKLDMELIRGIDKDPYKASICRTLLDLAHTLGIESVAEGVETVEEWEVLRDAGATYIQGFLFAKPGSPPPLSVVPAT